jgi:N-acetylglutamate synthase-like GNAT family acetyltransferase
MNINIRSASNLDVERVKSLIYSILREYGLEPEPNGTDVDLNDIEANYINRGGIFELLEDENGELFGTVGLYPMNEKTVELRKMYFTKDLRGQGFGKKTLQRMIEKSKESGFKRIYLETATPLKEAIHLYEKFGFKPTCEVHSPRCDHAYELTV